MQEPTRILWNALELKILLAKWAFSGLICQTWRHYSFLPVIRAQSDRSPPLASAPR
jgi:hypothetical protein